MAPVRQVGRRHSDQSGQNRSTGRRLPSQPQAQEFEAKDQWLTPGLLDIHTHEDLEAELEPGLPEVTRHGTTSVVVGNCSIGLAFGNQRSPAKIPSSIFARVENIPKSVLRKPQTRPFGANRKSIWSIWISCHWLRTWRRSYRILCCA